MSVIEPTGDESPAPQPWKRRLLLGAGVAFLLWLIASAFLLIDAKRGIDAGVAQLEAARDRLSPGDLVSGKGRASLELAEDDFDRAAANADSPLLTPIKLVPFVGQQVRSVEAQTEAAADVVAIGEQAMREAEKTFEENPQTGPARVALMETVARIAADAEERMRAVELGPDFFLVGPVGDARGEFAARLKEVETALAESEAIATGFAEFLRGPSRYLMLAANNAEMRAGSGMWLSAGVLTVQDGDFTLSEMVPTGDLTLPEGAVPVTGEFAERWGWFGPTRDLRNTAATPRFDVTAPLAAQMWQAATGESVDGVLVVDPLALRALLAAEGPVDAQGVTLDADDVLSYIFLDQYRMASDVGVDQAARRDQLGAVARAAVDAFETGEWDPPVLVDELAPAGRGRHVLAWSSEPVEQEAWEAAGTAGELTDDSLLVSLMNTAANKLDQFLTVEATIDTSTGGRGTEVTVRLHLANDAPVGEPAYVLGPFPGTGLAEGDYRGILAVDVPGAAADLRIEGGQGQVAAGPDGPARVIATTVELSRGERREVTVTFRLPDGVDGLRVEPSAREPAIRWRAGDQRWVDDHAERVEW
ncbi:MAG: DUF4012 domain-containing protein [Acidimicrobiia bacterium]